MDDAEFALRGNPMVVRWIDWVHQMWRGEDMASASKDVGRVTRGYK
jgi:hypothetical protein